MLFSRILDFVLEAGTEVILTFDYVEAFEPLTGKKVSGSRAENIVDGLLIFLKWIVLDVQNAASTVVARCSQWNLGAALILTFALFGLTFSSYLIIIRLNLFHLIKYT